MPRRVLSNDQIGAIRALAVLDFSQRMIAELVGVSRESVAYHLDSGKSAAAAEWIEAIKLAFTAARDGRLDTAAAQLHRAANHVRPLSPLTHA